MKVVKDPVHGDVFLSYSDCRLIDTWEVQKLRRITQLGTVQWVYPGGTHTRFEHSIGTLSLALKIARNVLFERDELEELRSIRNELSAAAIFHDSGHLPFSHCLEEAGLVSDHKERSAKIAERVIESVPGNIGLSGKEVSRIILGERNEYLSDIISGTLDADRLDYLQRDQLHTGVAYGGIDLRLLTLFRRRLNRLVIDERGVVPAETVLHARFVLRSVMYDHKTTRCVQSMITRALEYACGRDDVNKGREMSLNEIEAWDDAQLLSKLEEYDYSKELISRIRSRSLYRLAGIALEDFLERPGGHIGDAQEMTLERRRTYENAIAGKLGLDPYEIIIDKGNRDRYAVQEAKIPVYRGEEELGPLENVSVIARNMNAQHKHLWGIRLYVSGRCLDEAREEFKRVSKIELQKPHKLRLHYNPFMM